MVTAPLIRAFLRLFAVQGAWSYERMLGIGMGYASLPLLEELRHQDPVGYREAVGRQAEFFNAQPFLAGLALGATSKAEVQGVPGVKIRRLRTALCGPLGALGDQLFWTGILPSLSAGLLVAVVLGWPVRGVLIFLVLFNTIRVAVEWWGLQRGWASGMTVGQALHQSWLPAAVSRVGPVAGFAVGLALPMVCGWLVTETDRGMLPGVVGVGVLALILARISPRASGLRITMTVAVMILLWSWIGT